MNYNEELQFLLSQQTRPLQRYPVIHYKLLEILTVYLFRLPIFRPIYRGKTLAIIDEAHRLTALEKAQIPAPRLLAQCDTGLMMSDLGNGTALKSLDDLIVHRFENKMDIFPIWQQGLTALLGVHQKKQYLAQAFARNMVELPNKQVAFLDFEEDPAYKLTLSECQVRDILLYLLSTVHYFTDKHIDNALNFFIEHKKTLTPDTWSLLIKTIKKFKWMRHLHSPYLMGRDGKRFARTVRFLAKLFDKVEK